MICLCKDFIFCFKIKTQMLLAFVIEKRSFENITKLKIKDQKPEGK